MKHVCGIFLTGVVTVLLSIAPATAAAPVRITVSGRGLAHRIVITDLRATEAIINSLCAGQHAGHLTGRPAFALAVQWSNGPNPSGWRGTFYPAVGSQLAAVDIPDFKLYTTNAILYCDRRVAGPKGLKLLARYGRAHEAQGTGGAAKDRRGQHGPTEM